MEFGNGLFLTESLGGFILDYRLYRDTPPADTQKLSESLERQQAMDIDQPVAAVVGDRGFDSRKVARELDDAGISNLICPRNPANLKERMSESTFARMQKRRGGTEARIAILKNNGGGRVCRAKGFNNSAIAIGFGVLAHNLWWIARVIRKADDEPLVCPIRLKTAFTRPFSHGSAIHDPKSRPAPAPVSDAVRFDNQAPCKIPVSGTGSNYSWQKGSISSQQ